MCVCMRGRVGWLSSELRERSCSSVCWFLFLWSYTFFQKANSLLLEWVGSAAMQLAFFWTRSAYTESMSVRGFPTIPCAVLTAQAKCFLSCFVQLPYYTDILRQRMLSAVVLQKFAAGSRGAHPIYGSWGKAAFAGPSLPGDMYSSCDVNAHEHKVVYLFYLLPVYKEGSMLCVVDPLQSPHNESSGHAGVQDQVVWTSSP